VTSSGDEDRAFAALLAQIERRGLRVGGYKQPCLKRRLAVRMRARGVHTYAEYAQVLTSLPDEYDRLVDALTINVTRFFRNAETYALLRERVIPALAERGTALAIWSAGCATGEEPYSLAILCREAGLTRVRIDATDLDPTALATLARAEYPMSALEEVPADVRARWFSPGPPFQVAREVTRLVHPLRHDLTADPAPRPPYDLIVCRNVVIYFDRPTQERLFERFHDALAAGGWLLLGKVEALFGPVRQRFRTEDARERLFRKAA
jgi:chemotaxis methyl-accepting protein methylase